MTNIIHRIGIKASLQKVYNAISTTEGISGWWTKSTFGKSQVGKTIIVRFHTLNGNEIGNMHIEIKDLIPNKKIRWKFIEGPVEWIGTEVIFDLHKEENFTIILFSHINWAREIEFKAHCSMKWAIFMLSLKQFLETGQGNPSPQDIKIDNWN